MEYFHVQFTHFCATSIKRNGKDNDQFPEYDLPLVGQTDRPSHKHECNWVSQCCEADQDAQTLSVDNQPRMSHL